MSLKDDSYYKLNIIHFSSLLAITIAVIIIVNLVFYEIDKSYERSVKMFYLQAQMQVIENIVVADIVRIASGKEVEDLLVVKNTAMSDYTSINNLVIRIPKQDGKEVTVDISNIIELIDAVSRNNFEYSVMLNNSLIFGEDILEEPDLIKNIMINEKLTLSILIKSIADSLLSFEGEQRIKNKIKYRIINSILFFNLTTLAILKYLNNIFRYKLLQKKLEDFTKFYKNEKLFISSCYEQSKKDSDFINRLEEAGILADIELKEYLPIFLSPLLSKHKTYKIDISKIQISEFIDGYNVLNNSDIELAVLNNTKDNFFISFIEEETLKQIIVSIIINFVQFRSSSDLKELININFNEGEIKILCSGIRLSREHLIKWSKNIFLNTCNPFILNFYQIFKLLEISKYIVEIDYLDNQIQINIMLDPKHHATNDNVGKVIKLCRSKPQ